MSLMNDVCKLFLDSFIIEFIDYILVYYLSVEEYVGYLRIALDILKR